MSEQKLINEALGRKLSGKLTPILSLDALGEKWRLLECASDCSFFLSWSWMATWVRQAQALTELRIYELHDGEELIALAIIGIDTLTRRRIIKSRTVTLNEAANSRLNMFIEYNGLIALRGREQQAWQTFLHDVCSHLPTWDEIRLTNVPEALVDKQLTQQLGLHLIVDNHSFAWITSLSNVSDIESILAKLGRDRRWQLRRSIREYEKIGALTIEAAMSVEQALTYFEKMGELHSARWQKIGKTGAFVRSGWVEFHRNLIQTSFDLGQIQLLRICNGTRDIGYIYNFVWRGAVLVLQTGFAIEDRNVLRPGYVSHLLAIQLNAQLGEKEYDFMIGDSEYKRVLGQPCSPQITVRLQRNRFKLRLERLIHQLARAIR